jgi:hypothetical protein
MTHLVHRPVQPGSTLRRRSTRLRWRVAACLMAVAAAVAGTAPAVWADAGVGIDPGVISGLAPMTSGSPVTVAVQVRNPGTTPANYEMLAQPLDGVPELPVQAEWFSFEPTTFELAGGELKEVKVTVNPPTGTAAGTYLALITAQLMLSATSDPGAQVGAAVATKFYFDLLAAPPKSGGVPGWLVATGAGVGLVGAVGFVLRRSGVRLRVERPS